jgi:hypothetical protein
MKAFPIAMMEGNEDDLGMDLRDYFAAKAFQSLVSFSLPDCIYYTLNNQSRIDIDIDSLAKDAYVFADAMIEARK